METVSGLQPHSLNIGIYRSSSIGDVVLATACLSYLAELKIPVNITWIGRRPSLQLLCSAFPEMGHLEIDGEIGKSKDKARKQLSKVDLVIDLQGSIKSQMICNALRSEYKVPVFKIKKNSLERTGMVLSARLRGRRKELPERLSMGEPQFQNMVNTLHLALETVFPKLDVRHLKGTDVKPNLPTSHDSGNEPWQKELRFGRWLSVAIGAAHETKRGPLEIFLTSLFELKRHIELENSKESGSTGLLLVGNESDRESALQLLDQLNWRGPTLNLAGKLSLWETALAIKETRVLLCNDTGLLHIAEAVGVPVAAFFGPTVEAFGFAPWHQDSRVFSVPLGCRPCSKHGKASCRYQDKLCFSSINTSSTAEHIFELIKRERDHERA